MLVLCVCVSIDIITLIGIGNGSYSDRYQCFAWCNISPCTTHGVRYGPESLL